ncbi:MAG TPA: phosphoenolpyruvate--protein phosphotransferase [Gemmatimonadaceae bacterium]|nr:phosphoenolpyruvate--protein phosphotransferase [Gemmatimonadaceae bacterium]
MTSFPPHPPPPRPAGDRPPGTRSGAAASDPASLTLLAPVSGVIVPLDRVPDEAFAQRLAGDGIAIDPLSDRVLAPCDARVLQVHRANHAVTLAARGLEIIIHVGLDTVMLKGEGFTPLVKAGDEVRTGDPLLAFDADLVARRARSLLTEIVVANVERVAAIEPAAGPVTAARDVLMRIRLVDAPAAETASAPPREESIASAPIIVKCSAGLHARPAATLAAAARRFTADVRLVKNGHEANARSVVSTMALEVAAGDAVTVVARGDDASDAVATLAELLATDLDAGYAPAPQPSPPSAARPETLARPTTEGVLQGVPASPGIAIGNAFQLRDDDLVPEERAADPNRERRALDAAIAAACRQLDALRERLEREGRAGEGAIFAAHRELLEDPALVDAADAGIRAGASAAHAWRQAYCAQVDRLRSLDNPLLAARGADLRDVGRRVLHLLVGGDGAPREVPPDSIVIAEELAPSDIASLDRARVVGVCTTMGSATSHAAILARGLGIPAVAGMDPRALALPTGTRVVLDGDAGLLDTAPDAARMARIAERQAADARRRASELAAAASPAITRDGHRVEVVANIGDVDGAHRVPEVGGEGVGLLRSEFLFLHRHAAPDEDEQTRSYEAVARALGPERILVIRTLDVGGDKALPYLAVADEANPFLGERGVRLTLNHPALFRAQIRAILRASVSGRVAMMFPMIATLAEWRAAREMVERERAELGVPAVPVGIMVETAAAALMAERFAREADFFSIGTNDLTQYTLAMDRSNPRLAPQLDALHPAVLRLIERTVDGAHAHGRWVGVCGAAAGDIAAVPVLVGLGVDELSADVPLVPAVKARVRTLSLEACRATAREALDASDGAAVREIVRRRHG